MSGPEHSNKGREITYHVGRKKGKIQCTDIHAPHQAGKSDPFGTKTGMRLEAAFAKYVWREAPIPSRKAIALFLWFVPAAAFGAIVWLIILLQS